MVTKRGENMNRFRIKLPGNFEPNAYGQSYYGIDKKGHLSLIGDKASSTILKRYDFEFNEELANQYGLADLTREVIR